MTVFRDAAAPLFVIIIAALLPTTQAQASSSTDEDKFWILLAVTILSAYLRYRCQLRAFEHRQLALLGEQLAEDGNVVLRHQLVDSTEELQREWQCAICEFANKATAKTCVLCGTTPEETAQQYAMMTSASPRDAALTRSFKLRWLRAFQQNLNPRQRRAQNRHEYVRQTDQDGRRYWAKKTAIADDKPDDPDAEHVCIQVDEPPTNTAQVAEDTTQVADDELERQSSLAFVSQLAMTPQHPDGRLQFQEYRQVDARFASNGEEIDSAMLERIAAWPFREKYAWFVARTTALMKNQVDERFKVRVHRENVFLESMEQLVGMDKQDFHTPMRVEFVDEAALDAGGVEREWFALVTEQLFDETRGLFMCAHLDSLAYIVNPNSAHVSPDHLLYYRAAGRLIGRALLEGQLMNASLALPLLKHLLGVPISLRDLEFFDQELYRSLVWMKENDGVEALALDFSVTNLQPNGEIESIDLKENGRDIAVTDANKLEYIYLRLRYIMLDAFAEQLQQLMAGVFEIVPQELILTFDYQELELVLCGVPSIDVDDWKAHTEISDDMPKTLLGWFWEVVGSFTDEERARLLQFTTGSSRVPVQGFKALTSFDGRVCHFTLKAVPYPEHTFPHSHTCFNRIDLPLYKTKEQLEHVLSLVINMEVTGFTVE